ncbi:MAG: MoaD/ThiS family protein [Thermodesulfobacteriota bacterium]
MRVQVELWLWLSDQLEPDFQKLSPMRSVKEVEVEEGLTVRELFDRLAAKYPLLAEKVFDRDKKKFRPNLSAMVTKEEMVLSPFNLERDPLPPGCKITVMPVYVGG